MARQVTAGEAWPGTAGHIGARRGRSRQAGRGGAWPGRSEAGQLEAGMAGRGRTWPGLSWQIEAGSAGRGLAWPGTAERGRRGRLLINKSFR